MAHKGKLGLPTDIVDIEEINSPTYREVKAADGTQSEKQVDSNSNNLTKPQNLKVEEEIKRTKEEMAHILTSQESEGEMWSYDDIDNTYNKGISFQEKEAYTLWMENKLGKKQTGFFARYSLDRSEESIKKFSKLVGEGTQTNKFLTAPKEYIRLMKEGVLFWDSMSKEFVPKYIYTTGNLYKKQASIKEDEEYYVKTYGRDIYEHHKNAIMQAYMKVYDERIKISGIDREKVLNIDINSDTAKNFTLKSIILSSGTTQKGEFRIFVDSKNRKDFLKGRSAGKQGSGRNETWFDALTLREAFIYWIRQAVGGGTGYNAYPKAKQNGVNFGSFKYYDIVNWYVYRNNINRGLYDSSNYANKRQDAQKVGRDLFAAFLQNGLIGRDKVRLEIEWNSTYNPLPNLWDEADCWFQKDGNKIQTHKGEKMVSGKIPIGFTMAKRYGGNPRAPINDIRIDKRRALSYNVLTGYRSILAYGVGVGKTWCSIFQVAQALELGICKRPLLFLPNQVYVQFINEIKNLLPQYKINRLYNMRGMFLEDAKNIEDNTISVCTHEALVMMGYSKEWNEEEMSESAFLTLHQANNNIGEKQAEEMAEKYRRYISPVRWKKSGKQVDKLLVDKVKFDYLVVDEAHNFKKLITSVVGKVVEQPPEEEMTTAQKITREPSHFKFSAGIPADRAVGLFILTDYIQQSNIFGNTLMLTATPFTNSPLEVWSMLSFVNREVLKSTGIEATADFFKIFARVEQQIDVNIALKAVAKMRFTEWLNLPALQNLIFTAIDYISPEAANVKRPNKIVLPFKSLSVVKDKEVVVRELNPEERVSSLISLSPLQKELIDKLRDYASSLLEWKPEELIRQTRTIKGETEIYYVVRALTEEQEKLYPESMEDAGSVLKDCADTPELYLCCEPNWNTTDLLRKEQKQKYIANTLQVMEEYKAEEIKEVGATLKDTIGIKLLRCLTFARQISVSPYLFTCSAHKEMPTYLEFVESSPKLLYVMECIKSVKKHHADSQTAMSGQIIYIDIGTASFPLIQEYLVKELGFDWHEVAILTGSTKLRMIGKKKVKTKSAIQDAFNGVKQTEEGEKAGEYEPISDEQRVKVLIGSRSIREGVNLQFQSSVLYQCYLDFNPTQQNQLEGRMWRQGNPFKYVRIVNPLMADSMDIFMFQKLEEKTHQINQLWNRDGSTYSLDIREFNPEELKYEMITDAYEVAVLQSADIKRRLSDEIQDIQFDKSILDRTKSVIDLETTLTFGTSELRYEGKVDFSMVNSDENTNLTILYNFLRVVRPSLITKDLFTDAYMKKLVKTGAEAIKENNDAWYAVVASPDTMVGEEDLNYSFKDITELMRKFQRDRAFEIPYGYSPEAMEDLKEGDEVSFILRGERYTGKVDEIIGSRGREYEIEYKKDGKSKIRELDKYDNELKKIVKVKKSDKSTLLKWGSPKFKEMFQPISDFQKANLLRYEKRLRAIASGDKVVPILEYPQNETWMDIFNMAEYMLADDGAWWKTNMGTHKLVDKNLRNTFYSQSQYAAGDYLAYWDANYTRDLKEVQKVWEKELNPQGITTYKQLMEKIEAMQAEITTKDAEMGNLQNGELIKERAEEIIREREEKAKIEDSAFSEGDYKERAAQFASLNCLLDMKSSTDAGVKLEVVADEDVSIEEDDMVKEIQERIDNLEDMIEDVEKGDEMHTELSERIEVLKEMKEDLV